MNSFEWYPARLLQGDATQEDLALLVLNQPLKSVAHLQRLWLRATLRVAADGGANRLHELSSFQAKFANLNLIIGDLDSLKPAVQEFYTSKPTPAEVIKDPDQYSTDFGKAITWIRGKHPQGRDIVAIGGIGGRVDQGISQLHQLYLYQRDPAYSSGRIYLLSGSSLTFLLKAGSHRIQVREEGEADVFGKHLGIIPLGGSSRITTKGLEWDVADWETQIGGQISTSNHIRPETKVVEVETSQDVLFTVALRVNDNEEDD